MYRTETTERTKNATDFLEHLKKHPDVHVQRTVFYPKETSEIDTAIYYVYIDHVGHDEMNGIEEYITESRFAFGFADIDPYIDADGTEIMYFPQPF